MKRSIHTRSRGFSLLELVIAVAIIGILAAIAIPSYEQYMNNGRRTEGMSELNRVMNQQERYFLGAMTYVTDLSKLGFTATKGAYQTPEENYLISASACNGSTITRCITLTATPQGSQANDGNLTINSRGEKTWGSEPNWPQ